MNLRDLCAKHGTDKAHPDHAHLGLDYLDYYERHLSTLRETAGNVLEIGILGGASLRVWRDWFTRGTIHGVDIEDVSRHIVDEERIKIHRANQCDSPSMNDVASKSFPFKVVIDDGSHSLPGVFNAFNALWPGIIHGGFYVIEDLHHSYELQQRGMFDSWFSRELFDLDMRVGTASAYFFYPRILFIQKA